MSKPNIYTTPEPWSLVASGYEETTMFYLGEYSKRAITLAHLSSDQTILDVACGPGTLSRLAAPKVSQVTAIDFSKKMIDLFDTYISESGIKNIETHLGDGQQLTFADSVFDATFSMFGLMFFPDRIQGFKEMHRVLKPGGCTVVSSWAPLERSPAMQLMFGALHAAKPDLPTPEKSIENLENPELF
jgi:ubiquinone/menaquinone biosynthesis C-methylase UbiE